MCTWTSTFTLTSWSLCIEAARGKPSITRPIIVIKTILTNFCLPVLKIKWTELKIAWFSTFSEHCFLVHVDCACVLHYFEWPLAVYLKAHIQNGRSSFLFVSRKYRQLSGVHTVHFEEIYSQMDAFHFWMGKVWVCGKLQWIDSDFTCSKQVIYMVNFCTHVLDSWEVRVSSLHLLKPHGLSRCNNKISTGLR